MSAFGVCIGVCMCVCYVVPIWPSVCVCVCITQYAWFQHPDVGQEESEEGKRGCLRGYVKMLRKTDWIVLVRRPEFQENGDQMLCCGTHVLNKGSTTHTHTQNYVSTLACPGGGDDCASSGSLFCVGGSSQGHSTRYVQVLHASFTVLQFTCSLFFFTNSVFHSACNMGIVALTALYRIYFRRKGKKVESQ